MTAASPSSPDEDRAWATIHTALRPEELSDLSRDVEVLFRLNPYYYFNVWRQTGPDTFHVEFENKSNQLRQSLDLHVAHEDGRGLTVAYSGGIKKHTAFAIEPVTGGSRLTVTDDYNLLPVAEREQRQAEVDKSLKAWAESLRVYFLRLKRWSWLPGWRWYMRRIWIPMKPSSRRIVWLLYLITVAEFFFFLFVLLIYLIEQGN